MTPPLAHLFGNDSDCSTAGGLDSKPCGGGGCPLNKPNSLSADGGGQDAGGCCFGATIASRGEGSIFGGGGMSDNGNIPMDLPRLIL